MISVVIPTYKEPEVLDLCLESAIKGQTQKNQIIVVVDGFYDLNKEVLKKYEKDIEVLTLPTNQGLAYATNLGVYNATSNKVLVVNDDNVFPDEWDVALVANYSPNCVLTPNQIEPYPSMFKQMHIKDLGKSPESFDLEKFWEYEESIIEENKIEETGCTLPFFINKWDYIKIGGWDTDYPGNSVVDWDFFLKCEVAGMRMLRTYECHFYHFVAVGTEATYDEKLRKQDAEKRGHEYFKYKWGQWAKNNPENNSKMLDF